MVGNLLVLPGYQKTQVHLITDLIFGPVEVRDKKL